MSDWFSCCCDYGFRSIYSRVFDEWYLVGIITSPSTQPAFDIIKQNDGTVVLNNQTGKGQLVLCDDLQNVYGFSSTDYQKHDKNLNLVWGYTESGLTFSTDSLTSISGLSHYDVDVGYNSYYSGTENAVIANTSQALLRKINSSGSSEWLASAFTAFASERTRYRFFSCAADKDGNVCAVGVRQKVQGVSTLLKSDYIVYAFDSDGNELWHDDVPDDATNNSNYSGSWARQVCCDNSGNFYVGFNHQSSTVKPFVRKYDSGGTIIWTKTNSGVSMGSCYCILLTPNEKLVVQSSTFTGFDIRQYSDMNHSTLDWTTNIPSASIGGDMTCDQSGDLYANVLSEPVITTRWYKIEGSSGTSIDNGPSGFPVTLRSISKPGKHPHFM